MKQKEKAKRAQFDNKDLLFITDRPLRRKVTDAIETISGLYLVEKDKNYPPEISKEIRRIIILYAASIVEALLLYLYKQKKFSITKTDYKNPHILPSEYQKENGISLVIAKQIKIPKNERELMLDVLLEFFCDKGIIGMDLNKKIKKAKDVRNTFHLSKSRLGIQCSQTAVKTSTDALYKTIIIVKDTLTSNQLHP